MGGTKPGSGYNYDTQGFEKVWDNWMGRFSSMSDVIYNWHTGDYENRWTRESVSYTSVHYNFLLPNATVSIGNLTKAFVEFVGTNKNPYMFMTRFSFTGTNELRKLNLQQNSLLDWNSISETEKLEIMLSEARNNGTYIINLDQLFYNTSRWANEKMSVKKMLSSSYGGGGFLTKEPINVTLGGKEYSIWARIPFDADHQGNINPEVNLTLANVLSYDKNLAFGPGTPFEGVSGRSIRLVVYGSQDSADSFSKWYHHWYYKK